MGLVCGAAKAGALQLSRLSHSCKCTYRTTSSPRAAIVREYRSLSTFCAHMHQLNFGTSLLSMRSMAKMQIIAGNHHPKANVRVIHTRAANHCMIGGSAAESHINSSLCDVCADLTEETPCFSYFPHAACFEGKKVESNGKSNRKPRRANKYLFSVRCVCNFPKCLLCLLAFSYKIRRESLHQEPVEQISRP
jgi:hypothetical protein